MHGPDINTMTDEQIGALSDAELEAMLEGDATDEGAGPDEDADEDEAGNPDVEAEASDDDEDGEDEGEEEEEEEAGSADTDAQREADRLRRLAKDDDGKIPRSRLNEVIRERDQYREIALEALRNKEPAAKVEPEAPAPQRPEYDIKAGMREYHKLLTEGEEDKAIAKLEEVEEARSAITQFDLEQAARRAEDNAYSRVAKDTAQERVATAMSEAFEKYPFLNHESKGADPDAIAAVNVRAKQLVAEGRAPHVAIRLASQRVGERFAKLLGLSTGGEGKAGASSDAVAKAGKERSEGARKRGLEVRQPSTQKMGVGTREGGAKLDINKLTDKQLDKLSQAELDELLGNVEA